MSKVVGHVPRGVFDEERYLKSPMVDGESDYLFPDEKEVALGSQRGDGDQLRLAFDRELRASLKKVSDDITGHGGQMYMDKKMGYYRLVFKDKTVTKFGVGIWKTYNLSMKINLLKNSLRTIIARITEEEGDAI